MLCIFFLFTLRTLQWTGTETLLWSKFRLSAELLLCPARNAARTLKPLSHATSVPSPRYRYRTRLDYNSAQQGDDIYCLVKSQYHCGVPQVSQRGSWEQRRQTEVEDLVRVPKQKWFMCDSWSVATRLHKCRIKPDYQIQVSTLITRHGNPDTWQVGVRSTQTRYNMLVLN
jgi:hypothetical protein